MRINKINPVPPQPNRKRLNFRGMNNTNIPNENISGYDMKKVKTGLTFMFGVFCLSVGILAKNKVF